MVVKLVNLEKALKKIENIKNLNLTTAMVDVGITVQRQARAEVPVDTGELKRSINFEPLDSNYKNGVVVFANKEYAQDVEFGTSGPRFIEFYINGKEQPILAWAKRHGFDVTKMTGITVSGKPQPYMYPAYLKTKKEVSRIIQSGAETQLDKITGS